MLLLTLSTKNTSRNDASDFTCIYPDSQLYSSPSLSLKCFRASPDQNTILLLFLKALPLKLSSRKIPVSNYKKVNVIPEYYFEAA